MGKTRRQSPVRWVIKNPWWVVIVIGAIAFGNWVIGTRQQPHHVRAAFTTAFNLLPGLNVTVDGLEVGRISDVQYEGGQAVVTIGIKDEKFWPLHDGTTLESRWGTTIGSGTRRLDLVPGPSTARAIPEGGIIPAKDTTPAVDVDQVLNALDASHRAALRSMLGHIDSGLTGRAGQLGAGLAATAPALDATRGVLTELAADRLALSSLVTNTSRATAILAGRAGGIRDLLSVANRTFSVFAANTQSIQQSLDKMPGTFAQARTTLSRVDASLGGLNALVTDLRPGAAALPTLATAARPAFADLRSAVPPLTSTVRTLTDSAPSLTRLLGSATPFLVNANTAFSSLTPMVGCIRPYAPEAGSAVESAGGWVQGYVLEPRQSPQAAALGEPTRFNQRSDTPGFARVHGIRAMPQVSTASFHSYPPNLSTQNYTSLLGKQYAEPRPPGLSVGQPWFLPQCGVTQSALDPSKDPEQQH